MKDIKIFLKKKKNKTNNMVMKVIKISQKMKKINWLSIEKYYKMRKKTLYSNYKKVFKFRKFLLFCKGKYRKLFSFALIFEKFPLNKEKCEKKYNTFLIFRLCKFLSEFFKLEARKFHFLK